MLIGQDSANASPVNITVKNGGFISNVAGTIVKGSSTRLKGNSKIGATSIFSHAGSQIAPGVDAGDLATLTFEGEWDATDGGKLFAEIGDSGDGDVLAVSDNATLGGDCTVTSVVDSSSYEEGDSWAIVTASESISGQFDNLPGGIHFGNPALPALDSDLGWSVQYGQNALTLTVVDVDSDVFIPELPILWVYGTRYADTIKVTGDAAEVLVSIWVNGGIGTASGQFSGITEVHVDSGGGDDGDVADEGIADAGAYKLRCSADRSQVQVRRAA